MPQVSAIEFLRSMPQFTTARLRLEPFTDAHVNGLNALNADPEVMRYISGRPERLEETVDVVQRVKQRWIDCGYSWWSFIDQASGELVGAGCLQNLRRGATPAPDPACPLEIGWRLRRDRWGHGLATEAAHRIASFAFDDLRAAEIYAVCDPANTASANVMKRLGMQFRGLETWYDKNLATYQITSDEWHARAGEAKSDSR
jgi:RimJ/RimL family protein N-acetyltransferase